MKSEKSLAERDIETIWHPFTQHYIVKNHIVIEKAKGVYLYTEDGRAIIDAISSWWVNLYGHSNPIIADAICKQAHHLEHVIFADFTHKPAIELSEKLLSILPSNQSKVFFSDNGSTAVEVGLKIMLQFWYNQNQPKTKLIAIEGSYHGDTFGAMAVGDRNAFSAPFDKLLFDVDFIPFPNGENDALVLEKFQEIVKKGDVAGFIFEPLLQGTAGMRTYSASTLDNLIEIAHQNNVLCFADEVMTGFGRTGKHFASLYLKNKPDLFSLSKGITGGFLPLGVTTVSEEIFNAFLAEDKMKTFFHGHSYTANPISCAAAIASFSLLVSDEIQEKIKIIAEQNIQFLEEIKYDESIHKINQIGTIFSIELKQTESTSYFHSIRDQIYQLALEKNILLRPLGNVIYIIPPYIITKDELHEIYAVIKMILKKIK